MNAPRLSVVTPAFNAEATIETCVASVRAQTDPDLELIVVDDGSSDGTVEAVERQAAQDPRVRLLRQENAGPSRARNTGIAAARAPLVGFLDSDDAWLPAYAATVRARLAEAPVAGLCHANCWTLRDDDKRVHRLTTIESFPRVADELDPSALLRELLRENFVTASSVTVRRTILESLGGFEATLRTCEDWDLWLRIADAGRGAVLASSRPLVVLRETSSSSSKDAISMANGACEALGRARDRAEDGTPERRRAEASLEAARGDLERLEHPGPAQRAERRLRAALGPLRRRVLDRRDWRPVPPEVRAELEALGELPPTR